MASTNISITPIVGIDSPDWVYTFSGCVMLLLLLAGVVCNCFVLFVFIRHKKNPGINNFIPLAIITNGLCMVSIGFILPTMAEFAHGLLNICSMDVCILEAFTVYFFGLASLFLNTANAVYCYLIVYNTTFSLQSSNATMIKIVLACEAGALVFALSPIFGWGSYGLEAHGTSCGLAWHDRSAGNFSYIVTIGIVCFLIPVIIIIYSYAMILKIVRHSARALRSEVLLSRFNQRGKEMRLIRLSFCLVFVFLLSWTPYAVVSFYVLLGNHSSLHPLVSRSAAFFAKAEVVWNPIIVMVTVKEVRKTLVAMIPCKQRNETTISEISRVTTVQISQTFCDNGFKDSTMHVFERSKQLSPRSKSETVKTVTFAQGTDLHNTETIVEPSTETEI